MIPPDAERQFAQRMGADTIEVASGHCAMVSHPVETHERIVNRGERCRRAAWLASGLTRMGRDAWLVNDDVLWTTRNHRLPGGLEYRLPVENSRIQRLLIDLIRSIDRARAAPTVIRRGDAPEHVSLPVSYSLTVRRR